MSGMAEVIADALSKHSNYVRNEDEGGVICDECGWEVASKWQVIRGRTAERMNEHEAFAVLEALTKAGFGNVQEAKRDALLELAESPEALERARKRIEDELVEWRDAGRFMLRNNGLMIRNRDSTGSEIIRFGFEDGLRIALEAEAQFIAALNDPEGHNLVQAIHDRKAEGECGL